MRERIFKLYSPLTGEAWNWRDNDTNDFEDNEEINGHGLVQYADEIGKAVEAYSENLMKYFDGSDFIKRHVLSAVPSVEIRDGQLYGCTTVQMDEDLSELGWNQLMDYLSGQYADGWGEGFEQRDISVADGVLNVHFWQPNQRCPIVLDTLPSQEPTLPRQAHKPKMKLIGQDGNIFSILGRAGRLLRQHGQRKQAEEMFQRVQNCGDYNKALGIISEYVQTELPAPEKGDASRSKKDQQER